MSREILSVVEVVSNEKGVEEEIIFEAIEAALASATRKRHGDAIDVRVSIDRDSGDYETFRRWEIVDLDKLVDKVDEAARVEEEDEEVEPPRVYDSERMIPMAEAPDGLGEAEFVEEKIESEAFGRIAAQTAKQVIVQKVREAERAKVVEAYKDRIGELVMGVVKRMERGNVILDLGGNAEAAVLREELIPRELVRPGDRMRGFLRDVRPEPRGPQLFVSRTAPELMVELFRLEVPEIGENLIEVMGCARDPGLRAKIGVRTTVPRIDPVGACVGMRGSRVQAVSNELSGERVDIILWDESPAQFVINAMSPAEVLSIVVDEDARSMDVAVAEEQLSQAIGRGGQNVRLASQLTGWELNVMTEQQAEEKGEKEQERIQALFMEHLGVDGEVSNILIQEGFTAIEEVAYVVESEMIDIEEFDEDIVKELQSRARDVLLTREIANEEGLVDQAPAEDLTSLDGMDEGLAVQLARHGVVTREDLAELAVDDMQDIADVEGERAASLIMEARKIWFEDEAQA